MGLHPGRHLFLALSALISAFWLFLATAVLAQDYQFSGVSVEGNQRVDSATVLRYAGISAGQTLTAGQLNDAVQAVVNSGLFETVDVETGGSVLVFRVREYPTINVISFEGNRRLSDEEIDAVVKSESRRVYSPAQAEADAAAIAEAYTAAGRISATVTPRIIRRSENRVDLVFEITEGRVVEVERLAFVGNRAFSDRRLRQVLETKQAGLLRTFIRADTFIADRIELDKQLLRDFYAARGFVDFEVLDATSAVSAERDGFFVTFTLREGQSFRVGKVDAISEVPEIDPAPFADVLRLRPGVTYSPSVIDNNIARMENLALQQGLNFIRVEPRVTRNDRDLTLDVTFAITRGPRIFVERIDIEGNTTTLDEVVRREFRTVEGDPFNPREIRRAAERIRALGFFSDVQVTSEPGTAADQVIVNVDVEEQPTGTLSLGASFSVSDGVGLNLGFTETNFLGRGQTLGLSISGGSDNLDASANFFEPAFLDRDLGFRLSFFSSNTRQFNSFYNTDTLGGRTSLAFPTGDYARIELRYLAKREQLTDVSVNSSTILKRDADRGSLVTSALGYLYDYDTRTGALNPLGGVQLRFGQDFAGIGGDVQSITTTALARIERRVLNEEVTLRATFEASALNMIDDDSRVTDRNFGNGEIRGFESNGIGPRDLTAVNQDALGGNYSAVARLEAEFPLGIPNEYGLKGGVFMDAGSVWSLNDIKGTGGPVDDSFNLRAVLGVSVFWTTPIGPLRFNFTRAIVREDYDREQNFDLTVSTTF
ncbi:MAG: outer membrane protein assembly factor BamA [Rhodobacter sp.]|nr:outer membrane protein assembly factor BamA [Rhodobacter sp.]MCA3520099.1 outer membrane protein assembly factor BamA [Rhodobacter sp.]MCA3522030.1 outer membrane protein assembly factor BamA [Rhodobacter sp.]MCA3526450.1 outer membrane protein assembly factor BamA [Rhodobacter sp.]MCA3527850.1 outer membrane protein assembly factor BamA [Rhodobacter sp.]